MKNPKGEKLKRCVYCLSPKVGVCGNIASENDYYYVRCRECECRGPMQFTQEEAIKAWNRRKRE